MPSAEITCDAVVIGGGVAGLWTLHTLTNAGLSAVLVERDRLGAGQTLWSQGIIHSGLKYTLGGSMTEAAGAIGDVPALWKRCLQGDPPAGEPDLSAVQRRSDCCWLWRTKSLRSRFAMIGARAGLREKPSPVAPDERPAVLRSCPGTVARIAEPVLSPGSLVASLAAPLRDRIVHAPDGYGIRVADGAGVVVSIGDALTIAAPAAVLTAGGGNAPIRRELGLPEGAMQIRPLRMVLARGPLPRLCGHCVDGAATRVTITDDGPGEAEEQLLWRIGGAIAERGSEIWPDDLLALAAREVAAVLPGIDLSGVRWSWYDAPRAERATPGRSRPDSFALLEEGPVITAWPTKLVLAPALARAALAAVRRLLASVTLGIGSPEDAALLGALEHSQPPPVAEPPWRVAETWTPTDELTAPRR